ncbi:MAG: hypothetical protein B6U85_05605 [Desulfurococcales archaeon ex4484_42]|nr:MAG: hypothetical protein B6U85_05605 [Desulfurococcales archaeon ex4484_42]
MAYRIPFVDRVRELGILRDLSVRGLTKPLFIYGPEGCGKTRLLREFIRLFDGVGIYIDALEGRNVDLAVKFSSVLGFATSIVKELMGGYVGDVGRVLAERVSTILVELLTKLRLKGSRVVVVVDDVVRALGIDRVEWYVKWLYELLWKVSDKFDLSSMLIVVTTSEGSSLDVVMRHTVTHVKLLWNLDRAGFKDLALRLGPPSSDAVEEVWRVAGGNPRALIEVAIDYGWDVGRWLRDLGSRLLSVVERVRHEGLVRELEMVIDDVDTIHLDPSGGMIKLRNILIEENLILAKYVNTLTGEELVPSKELGIGRYYAWQLPAYRTILKSLLKQEST